MGAPQFESDYTTRIAVHYFHLALTRAGVPWDSDFEAELRAAFEPIDERLRKLEDNIASLDAAVYQLSAEHV